METLRQLNEHLAALLLDKQLSLSKDNTVWSIDGVVLPQEPIKLEDFLFGYCNTSFLELTELPPKIRNAINEATVKDGRVWLANFSTPITKFIEM